MINAHSAKSDTNATYEILLAQIEKYDELENNIDFLSDFSQIGEKYVDLAGFIRYNKNQKYLVLVNINQTLSQIWHENPGYFSWINQAEFPRYTKKITNDFVIKMKLENKFNKS